MRLCAPIGTKHELYNSGFKAAMWSFGSLGQSLSLGGDEPGMRWITATHSSLSVGVEEGAFMFEAAAMQMVYKANFFTKPVPVGGRKSKIYTIYKIIVLENNWGESYIKRRKAPLYCSLFFTTDSNITLKSSNLKCNYVYKTLYQFTFFVQ